MDALSPPHGGVTFSTRVCEGDATPPLRLRRAFSDAGCSYTSPTGSSRAARLPLSPLLANACTPTPAPSSCSPCTSEVPTPCHSPWVASPGSASQSDSSSPWSPVDPERAAWLAGSSPSTAAARRVDALLSFAGRPMPSVASPAGGDNQVADDAQTPGQGAHTPGSSGSLPPTISRELGKLRMWRARNEALLCMERERGGGGGPPALLSPGVLSLVATTTAAQSGAIAAQLLSARAAESEVRAKLSSSQCRVLALESDLAVAQRDLAAAQQAHMADLDDARDALLACDAAMGAVLSQKQELLHDNAQLRSRLSALKRRAASPSPAAAPAALSAAPAAVEAMEAQPLRLLWRVLAGALAPRLTAVLRIHANCACDAMPQAQMRLSARLFG